MTNLEHFNHILKDVEAPQAFIDWSFRWMISAALQRRVWTPLRGQQLYPNIYLFLVADPGIGKGMSLKPAKELLAFHKYHDKGPHDEETIYRRLTQGHALDVDELMSRILVPENTNGKGEVEDEKKNLPLFALGPDCTTYEQLVHDMARSSRLIRWQMTLPDGTVKPQLYTHNSFAFVSTELSNLIKKNCEPIVNLMLEAYDCNPKYEYRTKNSGKDCIHRVCLNFAAGTTPDYMSRTFDDALLNEGMAARSFFIFAFEKRFYRLNSDRENLTQTRSKAALLSWLRKLSNLYGEVTFSQEAQEYLKFWYETIHPKVRPNKDPKMIHYYSRKELHVLKTAMSMHFADNLTMEVSLDTLILAMDALEEAEKRMHLALQVGSKNPLANIARKITRFFAARGNEAVNYSTLLEAFYTEARTTDLAEVLQYMVMVKKLVMLKSGNDDLYKLNPETAAADRIETASDVPFIAARQIVHASLDAGIRWGRNGKVIIAKSLAVNAPEEIVKLRQLIGTGVITGVSGLSWE